MVETLKIPYMKKAHAKQKQPPVDQSIPQLTAHHQATKLLPTETIGQFLGSKCSRIANGTQKVFSTLHWKYFSFLKENRPINEGHILSLMDSFRKDGYLFTIVYVNEQMQIIDGQHRFEAARRLKLPIYFMVMPAWGIREVTVLNVNSRNWTMYDFLASYARAGNINYVRFKEFCDTHTFEITTNQILVLGIHFKIAISPSIY